MAGFGQTKMTNMTIGICSHGSPCCPHTVMGYWVVTSSNNDMCNNLPAIRFTDMTIHTCPHCVGGMAIFSSYKKQINMLGAHRLGDVITEMCGVGQTIEGSMNTIVG